MFTLTLSISITHISLQYQFMLYRYLTCCTLVFYYISLYFVVCCRISNFSVTCIVSLFDLRCFFVFSSHSEKALKSFKSSLTEGGEFEAMMQVVKYIEWENVQINDSLQICKTRIPALNNNVVYSYHSFTLYPLLFFPTSHSLSVSHHFLSLSLTLYLSFIFSFPRLMSFSVVKLRKLQDRILSGTIVKKLRTWNQHLLRFHQDQRKYR